MYIFVGWTERQLSQKIDARFVEGSSRKYGFKTVWLSKEFLEAILPILPPQSDLQKPYKSPKKKTSAIFTQNKIKDLWHKKREKTAKWPPLKIQIIFLRNDEIERIIRRENQPLIKTIKSAIYALFFRQIWMIAKPSIKLSFSQTTHSLKNTRTKQEIN